MEECTEIKGIRLMFKTLNNILSVKKTTPLMMINLERSELELKPEYIHQN
jgi:hypothetical protein